MSEIRFCPNCGNQLKPGDNFCMECGFKLDSNTNSNLSSTPMVSQSIQQDTGQIMYGANNAIDTSNYVDQSTVTKPQEPPNGVSIASVAISILSIAFFFTDILVFKWVQLSLAIVGIILGIVSYMVPKKKSIGIMGIIFGAVSIAVWISLYLGWF